MGGIADYSGSLVLELPLARATYAAVQRQAEPRFTCASLQGARARFFSIGLADVLYDDPSDTLRGPEALRARLEESDRWVAYVVGLVYYLAHRHGRATGQEGGVRVLICTDVPEGKGVSSSAALEVAAMAALAASYGVDLGPEDLATACQWVENHVVGAPCGIMDQMTCACGQEDHLMRLLCQPATIEGHVCVPPGYRFTGIDSGIRHAVSGADYGTVRTAAFMGYRILAEAAGLRAERHGGAVRISDAAWRGYLANVSPGAFEERFEAILPARMEGRLFLERYGGITDTVTRVDPRRTYPVRQATAHPIYENARVRRFAELLGVLPERAGVAEEMGRLMRASHASYGACGLGSDGTDRLVEMVTALGPERGCFGAKITGGGSGGTVAVFSTEDAVASLRLLADRYADETGRTAEVFEGSSPGMAATGVLRLLPPGGSSDFL
jgi:L-arabinokinase